MFVREKLPSDWDKAWDSNYECWYYWNKISRKVAWLPPSDPECEIVLPAKSFNAIPHKYESSRYSILFSSCNIIELVLNGLNKFQI